MSTLHGIKQLKLRNKPDSYQSVNERGCQIAESNKDGLLRMLLLSNLKSNPAAFSIVISTESNTNGSKCYHELPMFREDWDNYLPIFSFELQSELHTRFLNACI